MMRTNTKFFLLISVFCLSGLLAMAQKRPLDHDVYDGWQNVSGGSISKDGKYVYYSVNPQQGDSKLYIHDGQRYHTIGTINRAASINLSPSGHYLTMLIKPLFAETREARIQKKRGDDMPKDSLGIFSLREQQLIKIPNVKSYKAPEEKGDVIAYLADQEVADERKPADSTQVSGEGNARPSNARGGGARKKTEAVLTVYHLGKGVDTTFSRVDSYYFTDNGENLIFVREAADKDSVGKLAGVYHYHIPSRTAKQISSGKGTYKNFAFDNDAKRLAFLAYKGDEKALNKVHDVYLYDFSADSAHVWVSAGTPGIPAGWQVGDGGSLQFSKDNSRLFFGIAPEPRVKDTTLVEFEHAKVDIWHWQDDYLQTQQLVNLRREQNRTYQAVVSVDKAGAVLPLADERLPDLRLPQEGTQAYALGTTDYGRRIESQWLAGTYQDIYVVSTHTGERTLVKENVRGSISLSPEGKYVVWFDRSDGNWYVYHIAQKRTRILNENILTPFANEDNDSPDDPNGYGIAGWSKDDAEVFINDKYDIWAFDLEKETYRSITNGYGRLNQITLRYQNLHSSSGRGGFGRGGASDPINARKALWLSAFNHVNKENGWFKTNPRSGRNPSEVIMGPYRYAQAQGGEDTDMIIYTKENYVQSPDLYISKDFKNEVQLSHINPQQASYNWGTAELFEWTTPKGYAAQGILYKPEDFDPNKKYPVIAYFYEIVSNGLYSYVPPTPTPSRLNISFFVSNGYIVLAPDIHYEIGYPGRSAEEYVNSGMLALARNSWVDSDALGIQGQSWGGYQVAHLITRTDMYAAAWSGAPVVNMTSAYGGIRWQSGMNRQFQYERTQSRIGATLWENLDLYIENSPLFHFPNVTTPVAIMHNDEDGAVPWYQGIEMFTGLRRLGKPVWLLNYNGDAHNLVQRQNRKDIQRRQKEFFDHFLKGEPAAPWIERGVPAIHKGIDWGFREDQ